MNAATAKKLFIVREVRADMLRPHPVLSKGAQNLWIRMLAMANAKTGELRHRDHWFDGADIQKRAQICDRLRKKYIQELVTAGYVHWTRERIIRVVKGRKRAILGETHYWVFKSPRECSVSSTVTSSTVTFRNRSRKSPTILSEKHRGGECKPGVCSPVSGRKAGICDTKNHHQQENAIDDDAVLCTIPTLSRGEHPNPKADDRLFPVGLIEKAVCILQKEHPEWEPWQVQAAVWTVAVNACNSGKVPRHHNYFVAGVRSLDSSNLYVITNCWTEASFRGWLTRTQENMRRFGWGSGNPSETENT